MYYGKLETVERVRCLGLCDVSGFWKTLLSITHGNLLGSK